MVIFITAPRTLSKFTPFVRGIIGHGKVGQKAVKY